MQLFAIIILTLFASRATFASDTDYSKLFDGKIFEVEDRNGLPVLSITKLKLFRYSSASKSWIPEITFEVENISKNSLERLRYWAVISKKNGVVVDRDFRMPYLHPVSKVPTKANHLVSIDEFESIKFELDEDFQSPEDLRLALVAKETANRARTEEILRKVAVEDVNGWGKTEWGMTIEQVKSIHPDLMLLPNPANPKLITPALREFVIDGIPFFVGMDFTKGKLTMVRLISRAPSLIKAIAEYSQLNGLLTIKYGEPTHYDTEPRTVGNKIGLVAYWKVPSTTVFMKCGNLDNLPGCLIIYSPATPTKEVLDKL